MILLALALAATQVPAPAGVCGSVAGAITSALQRMSERAADAIGDDSAPRATMRAVQDGADLAEVQANIAQLAAHHCPAYPHTIVQNAYMGDALKCDQAIHADVAAHVDGLSDATKKACDRSAWTRLQ